MITEPLVAISKGLGALTIVIKSIILDAANFLNPLRHSAYILIFKRDDNKITYNFKILNCERLLFKSIKVNDQIRNTR